MSSLPEFRAESWYTVTGHGRVAAIRGSNGFDPRSLCGANVLIDDVCFHVRGVEAPSIPDATGCDFGLLVGPPKEAARIVENGPQLPAEGRNGRWVKMGEVSVDSATVAITDPAFAPSEDNGWDWTAPKADSRAQPYGSGVRFWSGFGDGGYEVWAWVVDYGDEGEPDERVAQVVVTFIDDDQLAHWNRDE